TGSLICPVMIRPWESVLTAVLKKRRSNGASPGGVRTFRSKGAESVAWLVPGEESEPEPERPARKTSPPPSSPAIVAIRLTNGDRMPDTVAGPVQEMVVALDRVTILPLSVLNLDSHSAISAWIYAIQSRTLCFANMKLDQG